jgi:hypothetical protein
MLSAKGKARRHRQCVARDGEACFYCHKPLGADRTLEHLLAKKHGGPDGVHNIALAHEACNEVMGSAPVIEKIRYREARHPRILPRAPLRITCRDMVEGDIGRVSISARSDTQGGGWFSRMINRLSLWRAAP